MIATASSIFIVPAATSSTRRATSFNCLCSSETGTVRFGALLIAIFYILVL